MSLAENIAQEHWERLEKLELMICEAVPPIDPPVQYWLESDCSASYCREHARDARWAEMGNVGPTWPDQDWFRRDAINETISDGMSAYARHGAGHSDHSESCDTCGCTLDYLLTDYGLEQELDHYAENPVAIGDTIDGEHTYALTRLFINMTQPWAQDNHPVQVQACLKIAEDTWAAIEHAKAEPSVALA